jgi:hypothetical protein
MAKKKITFCKEKNHQAALAPRIKYNRQVSTFHHYYQ